MRGINKEDKFYIAGSLFSEAEVNQRLKEEKELRELGFNNIFNPINSPQNEKTKNLPTSADIFWGDTVEILDSDIIIADLSNQNDPGIFCEMGIVWACNHLHRLAKDGLTLEEILEEMKEKKIVAHLSDIRKSTSHLYKGNNIPWGYNAFVMGCIDDIGVVKDNFKEVLDELKGE